MSATLEDAATHPMIKVDFPLTNYTPASAEEIREFKELSRELAQLSNETSREKGETKCHRL